MVEAQPFSPFKVSAAGINVIAGASDVVTIRNVAINGFNTGGYNHEQFSDHEQWPRDQHCCRRNRLLVREQHNHRECN
jgi:hypothetical protein